MPPPAKSSGRGCCGLGCGGCLVAILLVVALIGGTGYYFFVVQAQAGVPAPAALVVFTNKVQVGRNDSGYSDATSGQSLSAGSSVSTDKTGRAAIQFPDGSLLRMASDTRVTVTAAQLNKDGSLKQATVTDLVGRVYSSVQHLSGGATFSVQGHSVSAEVRGTKYEVLVNADGSNLIKVFDGTVKVQGSNSQTVSANQQASATSKGSVSPPQPIQPDPKDPFPLQAQSEAGAAKGNNPGTLQTTGGDALAQGGTSDQIYNSPGGNVTAVLSYPGSLMSLRVVDPDGQPHTAQGPPPVKVTIAGPPGVYKATVTGIQLPTPESFSLTFASDASCSPSKVDSGGVVRETLSNAELAQALSNSGTSGVTIRIEGTSPTSARLTYSSSIGGLAISWTIDFYAATPNLGAVLTQIIVQGVNVTTQVTSQLTQATGQSVTSIPADYTVDRVYSCSGSGGGIMVIEGHR
jgi:FecR protein